MNLLHACWHGSRGRDALLLLLGHGLSLLLAHKYSKLKVMWHRDVPAETEAGEPVMVGAGSIPRSPPCSRQLRPGGTAWAPVAKSVSKTTQPKLKGLQLMNKQGLELGDGEEASRSAGAALHRLALCRIGS